MALQKIRLIVLLTLLLSGSLFAASDWESAVDLRKNNEIEKAEKRLKKYASPADFDQLKPAEKIEFLRGLLELAHIRALKDDVAGSLALLNWAEGRTDPYQRSIACVKYAEILLDLGEFDRAKGYLANADELIKDRASDKETGAAIGQGGEKVDTGGAWRELRDESDALKADIESEEMKAKFGATYGSYVKLRRLQNVAKRARAPRYRNEAMRIADEIITTDPASQFAAAAGYLKGELLAAPLTEETPKKTIREVKDYLDQFVKARPDGLYRGEALMLLGKISLEIEWNAKDAEKYYTQALGYFRKSREKRDAVSLYAAINDDLKSQTAPTQKPTSLNQWKNIIYHDEDPLKLYNVASSPSWYINDKEKDACLWLGFVALSDGNADRAKEYWGKVQFLDENSGSEDAPYPDLMKRLMSACRFNMFILSQDELATVKDRNMRLPLNLAGMYYMLGRFAEADKMFVDIFNSTDDFEVKALCMLCRGGIADMDSDTKDFALTCHEWVIKEPRLKNSLHKGSAMFQYSCVMMGYPDGFNKALPVLQDYLKNYKTKNRWDYYREAGYREIFCLILQKKFAEARRKFETFKKARDDSYIKNLNYKFKVIDEKGEYL
jgi:hypothetical protein